MERMKGIVAALLTPFDKDGILDREAFKEHIDFLVEKGVNGLYVLGTTGEAFLLDKEERKAIVELAVEYAEGRIPVFAMVGAIPTQIACELAVHARNAGASGIGAITPIYHGATQREIKQYYSDIARSVGEDYPVYLYNLPGCSGNDLLPETVAELAETVNVVGIKNSMSDMMRLCKLIDVTPGDFDVIQGCDPLILPAMAYGAKGAVSGISNVFPELFVKLYDLILAGDYDAAQKVQALCTRATAALRYGAHIAYFKRALAVRGLKRTYTRRPLLDVAEAEVRTFEIEIRELLQEVDFIRSGDSARVTFS